MSAVWENALPVPGLYDPAGIDIGRDGLVAIAELGNHRISYWNSSGDLVRAIGSQGSGVGQLLGPEDVALDVDRDRVFVADTGNRRVQVFSRAGALVGTWTDVGDPRGIATDTRSGRVYVADADAHRILVFDEDGEVVARWGTFGEQSGELDTPLGLAAGIDGHLYIADSGNQRVQWWDSEGRPVGLLPLDSMTGPGGVPADVGLDDNGDLYVAVERGILRFRGRSGPAQPQPVYEQAAVRDAARGCPPRQCYDEREIANNHEGVQRLAYHPQIGLAVTYAPTLRFGDWAWLVPERGFPRFIPRVAAEPSNRHSHAPRRLAGGADPLYAQALDTTGWLRIFRSNGTWYDPFHLWPAGPGQDLSVVPGATGVITTNTVTVVNPTTFTSTLAWDSHGLDPEQRTRRGLTGDPIPDFGWWNRALALSPNAELCLPEPETFQPLAILNAGYGRLVLRLGPDGVYEENRGRRPGQCQLLLANVALPKAGRMFRAFGDLAYDVRGQLSVLARDGALVRFDERGRQLGETALMGMAEDAAEALAMDATGGTYILTARARVLKHDARGRLLAEWSVPGLAGDGEYTDLAAGDDGRVVVTDPRSDRLVVFEPAPTGEEDEAEGSPCRLQPDKVAEPTRLFLGQTTAVRLSLTGTCASPLDLVVVVDASCQMGGERLAKTRQAAALLADALPPDDRLALVTFSDPSGGARLVASLASERASARVAAAGLGVDCLPPALFPDRAADGRIADGLRAGREALFGAGARPKARKALILVSPSIFDRRTLRDRLSGLPTAQVTDREHALWEARRLWSADVEVWTVGLGQDFRDRDPGDPNDIQLPHPPDHGLLSALALPWDRYRYSETAGLPALFAEIATHLLPSISLQTLEVVDLIPANMRLIPGSAQPPADPLPGGGLRWVLAGADPGALPDLSYRLEPLDLGRWPTNIEATARYTDSAGKMGRVVYPRPEVEVVTLSPTPTPTDEPTPTTAPSASPTVTLTASATATATLPPTPTMRPTATTAPAAMYLPIVLKEQCVPQVLALDAALVLDTSSSMTGAKLESSIAAAGTFLDLLTFPRDQAALIAFNSEGHLVRPLGAAKTDLRLGLASLPRGIGTRIDLGLAEAIAELKGLRGRREAAPVIVMLTDGRPDAGTLGSVRDNADLARRLRITVYAVGLGEDVLPEVLEYVAGDRRRVYLAPGPEDLEAIYREIARVIPCR